MRKRSFREWGGYILIWFCFFWVSSLCALTIDLLALKIIKSIIVISFEIEAILHIVIMAVGAAIPVGAISYLMAFHLADFSPFLSTAEGVVAGALHLLFGFLLGFPVWITGGVKWLAALLEYGDRLYHIDALNDISLQLYLSAFLIELVFYLAVKTAFGFLGKTLRIRQREELMKNAHPDQSARGQ